MSSCLIVKDIAQTVYICAEPIKKTSSANISTVADRVSHAKKPTFFWDSSHRRRRPTGTYAGRSALTVCALCEQRVVLMQGSCTF